MKHEKLVASLLIILAVSTVIGVYYYNPSLFQGLSPNTLVSAQQQWVVPQGRDVDGKYVGSFWNLVAVVNMEDTFTGVTFPAGSSTSVTLDGVQTALKTDASVEIRISSQQPYIMGSIVEKTVQVCGRASTSTQAISGFPSEGSDVKNDFWVNYWTGNGPDWRIYAPYTVTVFKNGQQVGSPVTMNDYQSNRVVEVPLPSGQVVRIENLGNLQGNYIPNLALYNMAMLDGNSIYDLNGFLGQTRMYLTKNVADAGYTGGSEYSKYWYGTAFFGDQHHMAAFVQNALTRNSLFDQYGGWKVGSSASVAIPVPPVLNPSDKSSQNDANAQSKQCLTEFLNNRIYNYAGSLFNQFSRTEFVKGATNSNGEQTGSLKLYIPLENAYQSALVNIRFPTELADTIIDRPAIGSFELSAVWDSSGNAYSSITGNDKINVLVKNNGGVDATGDLRVTCGNAKVGIYPVSGSVTVAKDASVQRTISVTNLGVVNQETNIPITLTIYDAYTGAPKGTATVYITLLPTLTHDTTTLIVHAVEKQNATDTGTQVPIPGLDVQALYADQAKGGFTDDDGTLEFTIDTAGGGGYVGEVTIHSSDNTVYKDAQTTINVHSGMNEVTLAVERKDSNYDKDGNLLLILLIVGVVVALVVAVGVGVYVSKKKRHRHR